MSGWHLNRPYGKEKSSGRQPLPNCCLLKNFSCVPKTEHISQIKGGRQALNSACLGTKHGNKEAREEGNKLPVAAEMLKGKGLSGNRLRSGVQVAAKVKGKNIL